MPVTFPMRSSVSDLPAGELPESINTSARASGAATDAGDLLCLVVDSRGLRATGFGESLTASCPQGTVINLPPHESSLNDEIRAALLAAHRAQWRIRLVVFLSTEMAPAEKRLLVSLSDCIPDDANLAVCIVSSLHAHFGDHNRTRAESETAEVFSHVARVTILRSGHIVSTHSVRMGTSAPPVDETSALPTQAASAVRPKTSLFRRVAPVYPLVHSGFRSCFVEEAELHDVIQSLLECDRPRLPTTVSLLGHNQALQNVLRGTLSGTWMQRTMTLLCRVFAWLGGGLLFRMVFLVARYVRPALDVWNIHTLRPDSIEELLTLCNPWNRAYVAIAGYNTGVTHFGWKFPGRTVVQTTASGKLLRLGRNRIRVDSGVLLKQAVARLHQANRDFHVLPNYSYISMGTVFMVPVHGSGSAVSTLGDTIESVLAYDMREDRFVTLQRGDPNFAEAMYNPSGGLLVLRLVFNTRPREHYYGREVTFTNPDATAIWNAFDQPTASNVEIRKSSATDDDVCVRTWFAAAVDGGSANNATEVARDSLGRLWDRLEENPVSSWVFHALVRRFGFHVELFLTKDEFEVFWQAHRRLPLSKIQLRFFRRDGMPNSPGSERDRISADLFMKRRDQHQFTEFMREHLPYARFNRGKHSL